MTAGTLASWVKNGRQAGARYKWRANDGRDGLPGYKALAHFIAI